MHVNGLLIILKFLEFSNSEAGQHWNYEGLYKKEKLAQVCADFVNFNKQLFGIPVTFCN